MNDIDIYQDCTRDTAVYPEDGEVNGVPVGVIIMSFGIAGEGGEVAEKAKKALREGDEEYLEQMKDELGDVLWYVAQLADQLDVDLSEVAEKNLIKLSDRDERGVLTGQGDNR